MKRLFFWLGFISLVGLLAGCSTKEDQPDYMGQRMPPDDVAIFARVGAAKDNMETAMNHLRIHKSLKAIARDDLGIGISPCEQEDTLFCLEGGMPLILPPRTGTFQYKTVLPKRIPVGDGSFRYETGEVVMDVELNATSLDDKGNWITDRATCDVSISQLTVHQDDQKFIYIISKQHGVVSITEVTDRYSDSWYLVAGRLIDLEAICKKAR